MDKVGALNCQCIYSSGGQDSASEHKKGTAKSVRLVEISQPPLVFAGRDVMLISQRRIKIQKSLLGDLVLTVYLFQD